jgi:hypothetical protein
MAFLTQSQEDFTMSTDRKQMILEARKKQRDVMTIEMRNVAALEQIADTLEELRIQISGIAQVMGTIATRKHL